MNKAKEKTVFLDIGGVLLTNGWGSDARKEAALRFGLDYDELNTLHNFVFNVYEIGSITLDQYLDTIVFHTSRPFTKEAFKDFLFKCSQPLPEMLSWLKAWKKHCGLRIIAVNNEGKELNDYRVATFGLHDCFDAFVSSCEVQLRKPDPRIFQLAMGIAMTTPEQCIYFDDRPMLVRAAQQLHIRAYHHTDFATTRDILEQFKQENNA